MRNTFIGQHLHDLKLVFTIDSTEIVEASHHVMITHCIDASHMRESKSCAWVRAADVVFKLGVLSCALSTSLSLSSVTSVNMSAIELSQSPVAARTGCNGSSASSSCH